MDGGSFHWLTKYIFLTEVCWNLKKKFTLVVLWNLSHQWMLHKNLIFSSWSREIPVDNILCIFKDILLKLPTFASYKFIYDYSLFSYTKYFRMFTSFLFIFWFIIGYEVIKWFEFQLLTNRKIMISTGEKTWFPWTLLKKYNFFMTSIWLVDTLH